jgi:hypothetical protein
VSPTRPDSKGNEVRCARDRGQSVRPWPFPASNRTRCRGTSFRRSPMYRRSQVPLGPAWCPEARRPVMCQTRCLARSGCQLSRCPAAMTLRDSPTRRKVTCSSALSASSPWLARTDGAGGFFGSSMGSTRGKAGYLSGEIHKTKPDTRENVIRTMMSTINISQT